MSNPLLQTIEALAKEKGVEPEIIITALQDAIEAAARKRYKNERLRAKFNPDSGQLELSVVKQIVVEVTDPATQVSLAEAQELYGDEAEVDMEIEFPRPTEDLGRIAAQTAKQVIFQKVREAERENIFAEYNQRIGEVFSGTVKRFENGDMILEINRVEAILPRKEQSRAESYNQGDRVRAVIKGVTRSAKGPQIVLSRTDPALLIKLFEQEVPEIYDGTVIIRGAVREAGDRAKVAVYSRERDVDPVGACVGMKGTRVQAIIRELRGEKIDIVEFSEDPVTFVTNGLSPAKVQRVSIVDDADRVMEVVVEDKQLSLAIGKKGQNVRLAAKLTGWRIDIKSEEEKRREVEAQFAGLEFGGGAEGEGEPVGDEAFAADGETAAAEGVVADETAAEGAATEDAMAGDGAGDGPPVEAAGEDAGGDAAPADEPTRRRPKPSNRPTPSRPPPRGTIGTQREGTSR
jgi:N utilization substance protein A